MKDKRSRSGGKYYTLAVLTFLVGIAIVVLLTINLNNNARAGSIMLTMPGKTDVNLEKTGIYVVFYEYKSIMDGKTYSTEKKLGAIHFNLKEKATGKEVQLTAPLMNNKYNSGGHRGIAIMQFNIVKPSLYEFSGQYEQGKKSEEIVLAIGRGLTGKLLLTVAAGVIILLITMGGAIFLAAFGYEKAHGSMRTKAKR